MARNHVHEYAVNYLGRPICVCGETKPGWNPAEGIAARDAAIARVDAATDDGWKDRALEAVADCARQFPTFNSDHVWSILGDDEPNSDNRAFGAVMLKARKEKLIEPTDEFKPSNRKQVHRNPIRTWKSLVFQET